MIDPQKKPEHPLPSARMACHTCDGYGVVPTVSPGVGVICKACSGRGYITVAVEIIEKRKETDIYKIVETVVGDERMTYTEFKIRF